MLGAGSPLALQRLRSELDLRAKLDRLVGGNTEEISRRMRIPSEEGKQALPPPRHPTMPARQHSLIGDVIPDLAVRWRQQGGERGMPEHALDDG